MKNLLTYSLPKKVLKVTITFTFHELLQMNAAGQILNATLMGCDIRDKIRIDPMLIGDPLQIFRFDYKKLSGATSNLLLAATFDDNGYGILTSINADNSSATGEIIIGTAGLLADAARILAPMVTGRNLEILEFDRIEEVAQTEVREQKVTITQILDPDKLPASLEILPPTPRNANIELPEISIKLTTDLAGETAVNRAKENFTQSGVFYYRRPVPVLVEVSIKGNGNIAHYQLFAEYELFPQFGEYEEVHYQYKTNFFKSRNTSIAFNKRSGGLQSFQLASNTLIKQMVAAASEKAAELKEN